ncbi:MAG: penicillin-binding transpeptidase domain-containing protein [Candidatus Moduliflexus flocculans]|nr:penicillin-binding transpeptidase domain-containing protein [Candidatus Moduliflexus flocculans]
MVSAFSTFPDKGVRFRPYFITRIEDKDGNVLEEARVESEEVVSPQTAYMMTYLMRGVVESEGGTAAAISVLGWPLAGKTGTTDEYSDAWFLGFSPDLCAGVWVGHDLPVPLGERQTGAAAALPIWQDFFERVIDDAKRRPPRRRASSTSSRPTSRSRRTSSSSRSTRRPGSWRRRACLFPFKEVFFPGTGARRASARTPTTCASTITTAEKKRPPTIAR